jgi:uncharacterized protein (DUF1501 family)
MIDFTRRQFLKGAGATAVVAGTHVLSLAAARTASAGPLGGDPILVLVNMRGGNDALNTVIPLNDAVAPQRSLYESLRPDLAIPTNVLGSTGIGNDPALGNGLALHPESAGLKELFDEGKLAIVNGVGLPDSSLSHFEAEAVWFTGDVDAVGDPGWMGRHADGLPSGPVRSLSFREPSPALHALDTDVLTVNRVDRFDLPDADQKEYRDLDLRRAAWLQIFQPGRTGMAALAVRSASTLVATADFFREIETDGWDSANEGELGLGRNLRHLASILRHDLLNPAETSGLQFYHAVESGFDTHANQGTLDPEDAHPNRLGRVSRAVTGLQRDVETLGLQDRVVIVLYSEFGRRASQNDSGSTAGTDHGRGGAMMVLGNQVNGGLYGGVPRLDDLDSDGNLKPHTDFRRVYATLIDDWLGGSHGSVLPGGPYAKLPLF